MPTASRPMGVFILGDAPPRNLVELSQQVERCGFSDLWFAEDYFMLSGFASAALALQATEEVHVGIGAVSNRVRHPAVTAMEASTLANAYPGRFTLGIGHGVPAWVQQMHLTPKSVLGSIGEAITDVKRLLAGETLTQSGAYYGYDAVTLTHPAPELDVLAAVVGPKSVDLCAEIADGMVISVLAGPRYVATVKERIAALRRERGLPEKFALVTYVLASVDEDRAAARAKLRPVTAFYLEAMGPHPHHGRLRCQRRAGRDVAERRRCGDRSRHAGRLAGLARRFRPARGLPRGYRGALRRRRHQGRALHRAVGGAAATARDFWPRGAAGPLRKVRRYALARRSYLPLKSAERFSRKASVPSFKSSVPPRS